MEVRRMDGRTDKPYFIGTIRPQPGVQKKQSDKKQHELEQQQIKQNAGKKRKKA